MMSENIRLKDKKFFTELLNENITELKAIKDVVLENEDYKEARKLFANYIRKSLQTERYLSMSYEVEPNVCFYPNENEEEQANRICRLELIATGTPHQFNNEVDWEFNPTNDLYDEWTWQFNRHHELRILAHQYTLTGNELYAETFVKLVKSWINQAIVPENAEPTDTKCWRTIETGLRSYNWIYALHAFIHSEKFDDDTIVDFYKSLWEHGWRLRNFYSDNNWLIMEMNGLCQISVICDVLKDSIEWKQCAMDVLKKELKTQVYPDGFQVELSTGYHHAVVSNYLRVLNLFKQYDEFIPDDFIKELEGMTDINLKMVMPNGILPDLNDGAWANITKRLEVMLPFCPNREDWKWFITKGKEGIAPQYNTEILPYSGFGVLRTIKEGKSYYGLLDAAPFGTGHQHEDKLNVVINCYDKVLITEGGNYAYDKSDMRKYVLSTRSHNTIRIDGMDQNRRVNYKWEQEHLNELANMTWSCSDNIDWVEGVYNEGYGDNLVEVEHKRKLLFVKDIENLEPFFIVEDRITPNDNNTHNFEILWHLKAKDIRVEELNVTTLDEDGKNICIKPIISENLKLNVIKGQEKPEFQGWVTYNRGLQGEYEPCTTLKYEGKVEKEIRIVTLLYPLYDTECPINRIQASEDLGENSFEIILENGESITIN